MNTRRTSSKRAEKVNVNKAVPAQDPQNPHVPIEEWVMPSVDIRETICNLTQVDSQTRD